MTANLTALISKMQGLLGDDGTVFSTDACTTALRQALKEFNLTAPFYKTLSIPIVADQKVYSLSSEPNLLRVISVHKEGDDDYDLSLVFDPYHEENVPYIRLRNPQITGNLLVRVSLPNTINGLDSATTSTVNDFFDLTLVDGGCMHACLIRARSRTETINLNKGVVEHYERLAKIYKLAFDAGLMLASQRRPPAGEPNVRAWSLNTRSDY